MFNPWRSVSEQYLETEDRSYSANVERRFFYSLKTDALSILLADKSSILSRRAVVTEQQSAANDIAVTNQRVLAARFQRSNVRFG